MDMVIDPLFLVTDYNGLEAILKEMFEDRLVIDAKEHPIMLTEPSLHNKEHRMRLTSFFFEKYQVPALYISKSSVLSAFSCSRSTALVLESGANTTYAVPVHDGYALQASMLKYDIGGNYLTDRVEKVLSERGIRILPRYAFQKKVENGETIIKEIDCPNTMASFDAFSRREIVRDVKESLLSLTVETAMEITDAKQTHYDLPDGTKVDLEAQAKKIPEDMFSPIAEVSGFMGIQKMVSESIGRTDLDIRKDLYNNIVVSGGNTLISGFVERVQKLVPEITLPNVKVKVIAHMPTERRFSSWIGGSILSSLGSFQQMWMSKQEFDEHGAIMIERKCA